MAIKTVKKPMKAQSKKNSKVGNSKKVKEITSEPKKQTSKTKALSANNKINKKSILEKKTNAKTKPSALNKDITKAPGKKHLNLNDNNYTIKESAKLKNDNKMKPESLSKRGRSASPRATIPNN